MTSTGGTTTGGTTSGGNTSSGCTDDTCSYSFSQTGPTDQNWSRATGGPIEAVSVVYQSSNCTEVTAIGIASLGQGLELATGRRTLGNPAPGGTWPFNFFGTPGEFGGNPSNGTYQVCYFITFENDCDEEQRIDRCLSLTITD